MPGDVGLVAKIANTIFSWATSEDGLKEELLRRRLANKKAECLKALADNRWDDLHRATDELRALSTKA